MRASPRRLGVLALAATTIAAAFHSCTGGVDFTSKPTLPVFPPVVPLTSADVTLILQRAVNSIDTPFLHVAVVDRTGEILGVARTTGTPFPTAEDGDNIAISLARTTGYFSNSQAPLSSRTVETIGTFHFPPTFATPFIESVVPVSGVPPFQDTVIAPQRTTTGIAGTPQGPLWQINSTNRGAFVASASTVPPTAFNAGQEFRPSRNLQNNTLFPAAPGPSFPSPGITLLPGAVPLFKAGRLVGGIGAYVRQDTAVPPDVDAAEFAAISGATGSGAVGDENFFLAIPTEGAITIAGVLLPYVKQTTRPSNLAAGPNAGAVFDPTVSGGRVDPFSFVPASTSPADIALSDASYLIGPRDARYGVNQLDVVANPGTAALTQVDVRQIMGQVVASANITRAQIRLPLNSGAKVIATIVDTRGLILAHFRMEDTLCDAIDVVPAKARSVVYYCLPSSLATSAFANGDTWPGFPTGDPRGIALTTRTLGFVSQPFYPPGIEGTVQGPLYTFALNNRQPTQVDRWGSALPDPGYQNGLTFFPGSVPLYKPDSSSVKQLVGALGVSGDGVEQNDLIAFDGGKGFEPPPELMIDRFDFLGVKLPYLKFPQTPR